MKTVFEVYRAADKDWYWRATRKGRVVCDGAEGYKRRGTLLKSLRALLRSIRALDYVLNDEQ